jgi:hypothetical protein
MKAKEWLETMEKASDFPKGMKSLIEKYGEMLIAEQQWQNLPISGVRISLPSDAEIHGMADEVSLRQDTRDRMIHAMGLEQGATWVRNNIREQLGSES